MKRGKIKVYTVFFFKDSREQILSGDKWSSAPEVFLYLSPAPRSSGDISGASGTFRRSDDTIKTSQSTAGSEWCVRRDRREQKKEQKKNSQEKLRSGRSRTRVRRATRRESSLCLSSMKPRLEYFKWRRLKIARSHYIPTGSHQQGRGTGFGGEETATPSTTTNTNTNTNPPNMPPLVSVTWHEQPDERKHVWLTHRCLFFLNTGCLFREVWHLEVRLLTGSQMRRWSRINSLTQRM